MSEKKKGVIVSLAFFLFLIVLLNAADVHADTIPTPELGTGAISTATHQTYEVRLTGTVSVASVTSFQGTFGDDASSRYVFPKIYTYPNPNWAGTPTSYWPYADAACTSYLTYPVPNDGLPHTVTVNFQHYKIGAAGSCLHTATSPIALATTKFGFFYTDTTSGGGSPAPDMYIYGNAATTTSKCSSAGDCYAVSSPQWVINGYTLGGDATTTASQIYSTTPANEATTSPVALSVVYLANASDTIPFDTVTVQVDRLDQGLSQVFYSYQSPILTNSVNTWVASSSMSLPVGAYETTATLRSSATILVMINKSASWTVGTSTWSGMIGASSTEQADLNLLATSTCDILNITGCFQNALVWAFVPSTSSVAYIMGKGSSLGNVKPFAYITLADNLLASATTSGVSATINFYTLIPTTTAVYTYVFSPVRDGLGFLIWFSCLVGLFFAFRHRVI